jgi:hypothetical protein
MFFRLNQVILLKNSAGIGEINKIFFINLVFDVLSKVKNVSTDSDDNSYILRGF